VDDQEIITRINELADLEHQLERSKASIEPADHARLQQVEATLDQLYDLLRQRRARRGAGLDPDGAEARPIDTVEHYLQ
jgi:uncharacterized membrane protein YccC